MLVCLCLHITCSRQPFTIMYVTPAECFSAIHENRFSYRNGFRSLCLWNPGFIFHVLLELILFLCWRYSNIMPILQIRVVLQVLKYQGWLFPSQETSPSLMIDQAVRLQNYTSHKKKGQCQPDSARWFRTCCRFASLGSHFTVMSPTFTSGEFTDIPLSRKINK